MTDTSRRELDRPAGRASAERRPRRVPFAMLIAALLGGGLCALLALNTATAASEVRERAIDAQNTSLNDQEQQLSRDVAVLQAPSELAKRAAALGLVPGDSPAFLRLNPDGSVTVLGAPAPASGPPPPAKPTPTPPAKPTSTGPAKPPAKPTTKSPAKPTTTPTTEASSTGSAPTKPSPGRSDKPSKTSAGKSSNAPKPTQTPTPTVTLPGGPR